MSHSNLIRTGTIQFDIKKGDISYNCSCAFENIKSLADKGVTLAVLPELWSSGFDPSRIKDHAEKTPEIISDLSKLAVDHRMMIAGSMPELQNGHVYNTLFLVDENGSVAGSYRKIHLFPPLAENDCFHAGNRPVICSTSLGVIGMMICYDLRFPELARSLALQGAQIILVSAQWPQTRIEHWDILLRARAIENQIFIIACNRCGKEGDLSFSGHSQIVSPSGTVISRLDASPGTVIAEINLTEISSIKTQFDCLCGRVPAAYDMDHNSRDGY